VIAWHNGGPTTAANGQGLCEACNHTKEAPGWTAKPVPGPRHTVATTTPTGHTYHSTAPPLPGSASRDRTSGLESTRRGMTAGNSVALSRAEGHSARPQDHRMGRRDQPSRC
ncbi:MAG: hypothetical protein ACTHL6_02825, partial [Arthrobacter sp.]